MVDPLGEDEAVTTACMGRRRPQRSAHCVQRLLRGLCRSRQFRRVRTGVGVAEVSEVGRVDVQDGFGSRCGQAASRERPVGCGGDRVADGSELEGDQVVELVSSVRRRGEAEPAARGDLLYRVLERCGRDVVAFVDDDEAVAGGKFGEVVLPGKGLQGGDVDDAGGLGAAAAAALPGLDSQVLLDAGAPLVGQCLAVDQDECGRRGLRQRRRRSSSSRTRVERRERRGRARVVRQAPPAAPGRG